MLKGISRPRRLLRKARVRKKVQGTEARPRLTVFRSSNHIYAQVITDDPLSRTLASASTLSPELKDKLSFAGNRDAAREVGSLVAKKALDAGIKKVVFRPKRIPLPWTRSHVGRSRTRGWPRILSQAGSQE